MSMTLRKALIFLYLLISALLVVHHYIICGKWFDLDQLIHHEVVEVGFIGGALALIIDSVIERVRQTLGW